MFVCKTVVLTCTFQLHSALRYNPPFVAKPHFYVLFVLAKNV